MLEEISTACDPGTKCNAQGDKNSWSGYKRHLDTSDCGVPIAVLLSSASMHDSRAAIPLSLISAERVTHLYDSWMPPIAAVNCARIAAVSAMFP